MDEKSCKNFSGLRDGELLDQIAQRGEIERQMLSAQMVVQGAQTW